MNNDCFIEIDYSQKIKKGCNTPGDVLLKEKTDDKSRIISTLSDGLGSGVKANVLAALTASMAQKYIKSDVNMKRASEIIMDTLPVCSIRKISYSTFTICDVSVNGEAKILEYDNPEYIFIRHGVNVEIDRDEVLLERPSAFKKEHLLLSEIKMIPGDRIICFSDGVTQAGMGTKVHPLGWRRKNVISFIEKKIEEEPNISAKDLSETIVNRAAYFDGLSAKDDITVSVIYYRQPRDLLIITGPPFNKENDSYYANQINEFKGEIIVSGGTSANIISRETGQSVKTLLSVRSKDVPPIAEMNGVSLVTEGMLTLNKVAELLEDGSQSKEDAATMILDKLLNSDRVFFLVGTGINAAHQDPSIPFELGLRRSVIRRIVQSLENKYLKLTNIELI